MVLPGVTNARLARFLRRQGYVGVGEYPLSGFVHLDVRERSYFWEDRSAPGESSLERRIRRAEGRRNDRRAAQRGELQVPDVDPDAADEPEQPEVAEVPEVGDADEGQTGVDEAAEDVAGE